MNTTIFPRTLDQRRARHAWEAVGQLMKENTVDKDAYAREAKKLPARILAAGLGQALAFLSAKTKAKEEGQEGNKAKAKEKALRQLAEDLSGWIRERGLIEKDKQLLESVIQSDAVFLRRATDEVLAYLEWLNRFLEAEGLPKREND